MEGVVDRRTYRYYRNDEAQRTPMVEKMEKPVVTKTKSSAKKPSAMAPTEKKPEMPSSKKPSRKPRAEREKKDARKAKALAMPSLMLHSAPVEGVVADNELPDIIEAQEKER